MNSPTQFHRIFGNSWIDFFAGTDVEVETEVDLSIKLQRLDIVIIRRGSRAIPWELPEGFDVWLTYNLLTFKSSQEALDGFALQELVGHFVNFRKRISPSLDALLPESEFRLFAVCVRSPEKLATEVTLVPVSSGVYDVAGFGLTIRVIVVNELPKTENNAMLHLFSNQPDLLRYGQEHYRPHSPWTSSLVDRLLKEYEMTPTMLEKLKQFHREGVEMALKDATPEQLRNALAGRSAEEIRKILPPEVLEALVRQGKANGTAPKPE